MYKSKPLATDGKVPFINEISVSQAAALTWSISIFLLYILLSLFS